VGHVEYKAHVRNSYKILVGKPEEKRPLGRPTHRWLDNTKIDIKELGCGSVKWINVAQVMDQWWILRRRQWTFGLYKSG
jgi:hypothetical protein